MRDMSNVTKTRFAPSPTGYMHLGNARTALFNALLAGAHQGSFLLRVEDTDPDRSRAEFQHALEEDLWWLDLSWQEGPVVSGANEPYLQSERGAIYARYYERLIAQGQAYPCFCSAEELKISRQIQTGRGQMPRYSGKCRHLSETEVGTYMREGRKATLRFRVPSGEQIEFNDLVRGTQSFSSDDIGDFIIRRSDGSPAFFFCNAVDDALMQVTHVLRGEDHLTNTPRQLMLLEALDLPLPEYGHISLIVGHDGSPLSKRHGSRSVRELRAHGYLPLAIVNYLARLGHTYESDALLAIEELMADFRPQCLGRAPSRYDSHQLMHWQHLALASVTHNELWEWMGVDVQQQVPESDQAQFVEAIRHNISFPQHALHWAQILYTDPLLLNDVSREIVAEAGTQFFQHALTALEEHSDDFKAFANVLKEHTGKKGKQLFLPLRTALSGEQGGPEMGKLFQLLTRERLQMRLHACLNGKLKNYTDVTQTK